MLAPGTATATTTPKATSKQASPTLAYDLVSANGTVSSFGGAANFGGTQDVALRAPIVDMATTPDGRGYWLLAQNGSVYNLGDAKFYGSLGGNHPLPPAAHDLVSIIPTNDGQGYWLCDASGVVTAYGDAPKLPSLPAAKATLPVVGCGVLPDELGDWIVNSAGDVYNYGQAKWYGSLRGKVLAHPIVGMSRTTDGKGYWLVDSAGDVTSFGDATKPGDPPALPNPVVGMTGAPNGLGYWAVSAGGYVIPGGVPSEGGLTGLSGSTLIVAISRALPVSPVDQAPYPAGSIGYDVNWPQCVKTGSTETGKMPGPPGDVDGTAAYSIAMVGVDGWAVGDYNSCLEAELSWAEQARVPGTSVPPAYQLYMFLNSPSSTTTVDETGPAGTCSTVPAASKATCLAYNYGYNSALDAVSYATSQGAKAPTWWLDIENSSCSPTEWNNEANGEWWSCNQTLNDQTIQGATDGLRHDGIVVGVYSTALQWNAITNHYVPTGAQLPLWIAGAPWTVPPYPTSTKYDPTTALSPWCDGDYDFAGGLPELLQETPGNNNYPFDPDYAC